MRLTRRGWAVLAVAVAAMGLSYTFGPRALNAVAAPALVMLAAGVVQVSRREPPTISRRKPAPGYPGEYRDVEATVEATGPCDIREGTDGGLRIANPERAVAGDATLHYEVELLSRGDHPVGPARVTVTDALGLCRRATRETTRTDLLVYPRVDPLTPNRAFHGLVERSGTPDRQAFDSLREYVPGDPLRDIHWKSSAKRDDLVVAEFATHDEGGVTVAAECDAGHADAMASAAASIVVHLLDADIRVGLETPGGHLEKGGGDDQRDAALALLARTPGGRVGEVGADVRVLATGDGVQVRVADDAFPYSDIQGVSR
ncbi:DUF58 domain-containing protein [Natronomonas sp. EA1]|uniref:DUF58 domain-containing protein n=1 Tax=Natronomonas sp. EA1 TaxID=3421655 RepID=UPI003EBE4F5F